MNRGEQMKENKDFTKIRHTNMIHDGISNPSKVDDFVEKLYHMILNEGFSIVEAEAISKALLSEIENDKILILRESLGNVIKFKEG